jgi:hypothetical protein
MGLDGIAGHCLFYFGVVLCRRVSLFRRKLMAGIRQMANPAPRRRLSLLPSENGAHICRTAGKNKHCYSVLMKNFFCNNFKYGLHLVV